MTLRNLLGEPIGPEDRQHAAYLRLRRKRKFWAGLYPTIVFTLIFLGAVFITRGFWSPTWWHWVLATLILVWPIGGLAAWLFWYHNRPITYEDVAWEAARQAERAGRRHPSFPTTDDDFVMGVDTIRWRVRRARYWLKVEFTGQEWQLSQSGERQDEWYHRANYQSWYDAWQAARWMMKHGFDLIEWSVWRGRYWWKAELTRHEWQLSQWDERQERQGEWHARGNYQTWYDAWRGARWMTEKERPSHPPPS